jgi:hypothetical protein
MLLALADFLLQLGDKLAEVLLLCGKGFVGLLRLLQLAGGVFYG